MYKVLSRYYDSFMNDVDYEKWCGYVCSFLGDRRRGVDMACGTGRFTVLLQKRGYDVYGVDISPQMLAQANAGARDAMIKADFVLGDMNDFGFINAPEFVIAMCDAVNYLKNPLKAFKNIYAGLCDGGAFVFDISSEYKLIRILGNNTYSDTCGDITYIWNNSLSPDKKKVGMELCFFEKHGELYKKRTERQTQFVHNAKDITELLKDAGFSGIKAYGGMTKRPQKDTDERIHFVAYKR